MTRFRLVLILLIVALAILPTALVWPREFTNWDDRIFVADNLAVQHPTPTNLLFLSTHQFAGNLIPVTMLTFVVDWQVFGSRAWGYGLTNSLIYAVGCLGLMVALRRVGCAPRVAGLSAVLFAVHPAHAENVSWISGRKDLVCFVLLIGTQLAYLSYLQRQRSRDRWLSGGLMLLAGFAKPMAVSAAPALMLYDVLIAGRSARESLRALWPHFAASLLILGLAFWTQVDAAAVRSTQDVRWASVDRAGVKVVIDMARCLLPLPFSPFYPQSIIEQIPETVRWLSLLGLGGASAGLLAASRRSQRLRTITYFWWLALVFLIPVSGLVPLGWTSFADRYLLVPSIGACVAVAWAVERTGMAHLRYGLIVAAFFLGAIFHVRALHWSNSIQLWEAVVARYPHSALAWKNLTAAHYARGDLPSASQVALSGLSHQPQDASLVANAAEILMTMGRLDEAEQMIRQARRSESAPETLELLLAKVALRRGEPEEVIDITGGLLEQNPVAAPAWNLVSYAREQLGEKSLAIEAARQSVRLSPEEPEFHRRLLELLQRQGSREGLVAAAAACNAALPRFPDAWLLRIAALRTLGRNHEAERVTLTAQSYVPVLSRSVPSHSSEGL